MDYLNALTPNHFIIGRGLFYNSLGMLGCHARIDFCIFVILGGVAGRVCVVFNMTATSWFIRHFFCGP